MTAALAFALMAAAGIGEAARRRREQWGNAVRGEYLRLVLLALAEGDTDGASGRFPGIGRVGARHALAEVLSRLAASTYGLDNRPLRRIVRENGLESYLLRRIRRTRGYRTTTCCCSRACRWRRRRTRPSPGTPRAATPM